MLKGGVPHFFCKSEGTFSFICTELFVQTDLGSVCENVANSYRTQVSKGKKKTMKIHCRAERRIFNTPLIVWVGSLSVFFTFSAKS